MLSKIPGLVMHLPLNESSGSTAFDNTRYSNDGSLGGGDADKMPVWTEHGLNFDGTDDYVDCGNDSSLNITDAITISAFIKTNALAGSRRIVGKVSTVPSVNGYYLYRITNKIKFGIQKAGGIKIAESTITIGTDTYYHVVGMYDGVNISVWINGVEKVGDAYVGTIGISMDVLKIGTYIPAGGDYFNGNIDDVRIYNRSLSAAEITDLYNERRHLYV